MDPLHLTIALGPLAVYFLFLGLVNLSTRPFLTTGARDVAALGAAISGFVVAGPMELFLPEQAASRLGPYVWLLLLGLYALSVSLLALTLRPRLVIYNITFEQLRPILEQTAKAVDEEARWTGAGLTLPNLAVSLHLEPSPAMRNVQLASTGPRQSYAGWRRLQIALARELRQTRVSPNPYGGSLLFFSAVMACLIGYVMIRDGESVADALHEMLRL
ncbi:MAG: hypothetical protein KY475_19085 [Planctomycetes bacterium]|nr:hypothetical protein [Planctomycetota bacterium]